MSTNSLSTSDSDHQHPVNKSAVMRSSTGNSSASALVYGSPMAPRRPSLHPRQRSYTHSFPSDQPRGLSPATLALAKKVLHPEQLKQTQFETAIFTGGLEWLLNSTLQAEPLRRSRSQSRLQRSSLAEDVIQLLNAEHDGKKRITEVVNHRRRSTEAWVSDQSNHIVDTRPSP